MSNWNIYRHESFHGPDAMRTSSLVAELTGDGWVAVYRREKGRYPNAVIGLRHEHLTQEEFMAVRDREPGEPRDNYDAMVRETLHLTHFNDKSLPRPEACVATPYPIGQYNR